MGSEQGLFNTVWEHFIVNRSPASFSINHMGNPSPQYRTGKRACAIGIFLPPDVYNPLMEGSTVESIVVQKFYADSEIERIMYCSNTCKAAQWFAQFDVNFLEQLQECHDDAVSQSFEEAGTIDNLKPDRFTEIMKAKMVDLAKSWELSLPLVIDFVMPVNVVMIDESSELTGCDYDALVEVFRMQGEYAKF